MSVVRVLHLSDLHARESWSWDQRKIVTAMLRDVEELHRERPVDVAVFTGDLGFSGTRAEFELGKEILLEPLAGSLSLEQDRIVLVPGNHDVDRSMVDKINELGLRQHLADRAMVNELLADDEQRATACRRLEVWEKFRDDFHEPRIPEPVGFLARVHRLELGGATVGVAALNSAWRSSGDEDFAKLLVGGRQVEAALQRVDDCDLRMVALHHPLDWLMPFDKKDTRLELRRRAHVVLSGHEHEADPEATASAQGAAVFDRGGCLYESHEYLNSYSLIDVDLERGGIDVKLRTWWPDRGEFDLALNVAARGSVSFPLGGAATPEPADAAGGARGEPSAGTEYAKETRYVLLLDACIRIAGDVYVVWPTTGEKRRMLQLIARHKPELVHGAEDLAAGLDAECPGAAAAIDSFVKGPFQNYLDVMRAYVDWIDSKADAEKEPEEFEHRRKAARHGYFMGSETISDLLQTSRAFATALAEQEQVGLWRVLGFESKEDFHEYLEPTMKSLTSSPGELAEDVLQRLVDEPVDPRDLEAEGLPKSITVDLMNRLLTDHWAQWDGDRIALSERGARLLRKRLADWQARVQ